MLAKPYLVAVPAALALTLAACGGSTGGSKADGPDENCASEDTFCIGLITDTGSVDDKSFNQASWEGALNFKDEAKTNAVESKSPADYVPNIKQFTDQKYDVIITVGFLLAEATATAAKENPDSHFIGIDQFQAEEIPNLTGLVFPEDQGGYAAGYLAGLMTKTNKIGAVMGAKVPATEKYVQGYAKGAKAANPAVSVAQVFHPSPDNGFKDPTWGAGEARKQLAQGADVVFGAGGGTGNGAIGEVAKSAGAGTSTFCIGVDLDQWNTVPEARPCLITSAEKKITAGTIEIINAVQDGNVKGGNFTGKVGLSQYHDFNDTIPADVQMKVADIVTQLTDGTLKVE